MRTVEVSVVGKSDELLVDVILVIELLTGVWLAELKLVFSVFTNVLLVELKVELLFAVDVWVVCVLSDFAKVIDDKPVEADELILLLCKELAEILNVIEFNINDVNDEKLIVVDPIFDEPDKVPVDPVWL